MEQPIEQYTIVVKAMGDGKWVTGCKTGDTSVVAYDKNTALRAHADEAIEHGEFMIGDLYRAEYIDGDETTFSGWVRV